MSGIRRSSRTRLTMPGGSAVRSAVLTFEPHPLRVLAPERAPKMLLTHKDKMQLLQALGVDCVVIQQFDRVVCRDWRGRVRAQVFESSGCAPKRFGSVRICVSARDAAGDIDKLRAWGAQLGFEVGIVEPVMVCGERVSSSRIRELLGAGASRRGAADAGEILFRFRQGRVRPPARARTRISHGKYRQPGRDCPARRYLRHAVSSRREDSAECH